MKYFKSIKTMDSYIPKCFTCNKRMPLKVYDGYNGIDVTNVELTIKKKNFPVSKDMYFFTIEDLNTEEYSYTNPAFTKLCSFCNSSATFLFRSVIDGINVFAIDQVKYFLYRFTFSYMDKHYDISCTQKDKYTVIITSSGTTDMFSIPFDLSKLKTAADIVNKIDNIKSLI